MPLNIIYKYYFNVWKYIYHSLFYIHAFVFITIKLFNSHISMSENVGLDALVNI